MKASKHKLKLLKKEKIAKDTFTFYFERKDEVNFTPGQYFKIRLDIKNVDNRGSSRYFTISSSPKRKEHISITTKIIKSSFKKKLNKIKIGEEVDFYGPVGYFNFNHRNKKTKIFIAGGIGITPFLSILETYLNEKINIYLFVSFPKSEEVVFFKELKDLEKKFPNFKTIFTLTKEKKSGYEYGRISSNLINKYLVDLDTHEYFIVGSEEMEKKLVDLIKSLGVSEENIFSENFTGY